MHNHSNGNELRILMQIKLISLTIVEHQDSLRNRNKQQFGSGPFVIDENAGKNFNWGTIFSTPALILPANLTNTKLASK